MYSKPLEKLVWISETRYLNVTTGRIVDKKKRRDPVPLTPEQQALLEYITKEAAKEMRKRKEAEDAPTD
jgi:hypothetical protein